MVQERWFFRDNDEWKAFAERLKLMPCPHCKCVGALIRHGCLGGLADGKRTLRARRVFCSNRQARPGCGRTVSVWCAVPYPALIAFFGESCRIVVRLHDVCYTDKSAKAAREFNRDLAPRAPHPA